MLSIAAWPLTAPSAMTKLIMEPSLEAFLAAWIRHFRHFHLEGKTYKSPAGRGLPEGFGAL
jgi:hypothetical protein